jgi:hypothetical protein
MVSQRLLASIMSISSAFDMGLDASVKETFGIGGDVSMRATDEICGVSWSRLVDRASLRFVS